MKNPGAHDFFPERGIFMGAPVFVSTPPGVAGSGTSVAAPG